MKGDASIAARIGAFSLKLLVAVSLLFVLHFVVVRTLVSGPARAEDAACGGMDLVAALATQDPALLRRMRKEAAATANGKGLLWRVEGKRGAAPSFLFGTMHVTDPRVVTLPAAAQTAFAQAGTVVIETTDMLDEKALMAAMAETPALMMFPSGESLRDHLTPEQEDVLSAAVGALGVPLQSVVKLKPWMLLSLVGQPICERKRQEAGDPVLDDKLAREAEAAGKRLVGLESLSEQLSALASLPMKVHIEGLVSTLGLGAQVNDVTETMITLYLNGETGMFWPVLNGLPPHGAQGAATYAVFDERLVKARNRAMVERALPVLAEGGAFIAVGALHLPGEAGLVALLRKEGFKVSRVD